MSIYKKLYEVKKAGIKLQRDTKAYNYKYATLDQIQQKLNPVLQEKGLIVLHQVVDNKVITRIVDTETNEEVKSEIELTTSKAQERGSEITYYRRYNLLCLLDLEVEDDDGQQASGVKKEESNKEKQDEEKPRFNDGDFEKWKDKIIERIKGGEQAEEIVRKLREKYKVSKKMAEKIILLETEQDEVF